MSITISSRLFPFSHEPPVFCMLPRSSVALRICPAQITLYPLREMGKHLTLNLGIAGPVKDFTVTLDLEKGKVSVFGTGRQGYFRYFLEQTEEGIAWTLEKAKESIAITGDKAMILGVKETLHLPFQERKIPLPTERLSCGVHKAPDWDRVSRRLDFQEIFPFWLKMGTLIPDLNSPGAVGAFKLLEACAEATHHKEDLLEAFSSLFRVAFTGMFFPHVEDPRAQGILPSEEIPEVCPLPLITQGAKLIRSLFFQEKNDAFSFLSCLPPGFPAGRMTGITTESGDQLSFEWSKYLIHKVIFSVKTEKTVLLQFPKNTRSFRIRRSLADKGKTLSLTQGKVQLDLPLGKVLLDRFQK